MKLKQIFCKHRWFIQEWYPLDKEGRRLFKDKGVLNYCEKCGKQEILPPRFVKEVKAE